MEYCNEHCSRFILLEQRVSPASFLSSFKHVPVSLLLNSPVSTLTPHSLATAVRPLWSPFQPRLFLKFYTHSFYSLSVYLLLNTISSGFCAYHSTQTTFARVINDFNVAKSSGFPHNLIRAVNQFDSVEHSFLKILSSFSFHVTTFSWISFLSVIWSFLLHLLLKIHTGIHQSLGLFLSSLCTPPWRGALFMPIVLAKFVIVSLFILKSVPV